MQKNKIISIIKYSKSGNTGSLINSLNKICKNNFKINITNNLNLLSKSDAIILPGVGYFKETMQDLENKKIISILKKHIKKGKLILGICIGMHLLFDHSEEGNYHGLGVIKGKVNIIKNSKKLPIIGWKKNIIIKKNKFFSKFQKDNYYYFLHSYEVIACNKNYIYMYYLDSNKKIISLIKKNNIIGVQFHPELSADRGKEFLTNFVNLLI